MVPGFLAAGVCCILLMLVSMGVARAEGVPTDAAWSAGTPAVARDVARGRPLVVSVVVPLCSNAQIDCGANWAGQPGRPETNVYWGALYGARRFFDRPKSGYERVSLEAFEGQPVVQRAVYRRRFPGAPWGQAGEVEQIVVLEAVHGDHIDAAVGSFWGLATARRTVSFEDQGHRRTERVHVAGYAGHNRLMDGRELLEQTIQTAPADANASFVLACYSDRYFTASLVRAGSIPLVTTRALMAPEGYLIHTIAEGLGQNLTVGALRRRTVQSYARWQRISEREARGIFAP